MLFITYCSESIKLLYDLVAEGFVFCCKTVKQYAFFSFKNKVPLNKMFSIVTPSVKSPSSFASFSHKLGKAVFF